MAGRPVALGNLDEVPAPDHSAPARRGPNFRLGSDEYGMRVAGSRSPGRGLPGKRPSRKLAVACIVVFDV
jgi:hypothetical protein